MFILAVRDEARKQAIIFEELKDHGNTRNNERKFGESIYEQMEQVMNCVVVYDVKKMIRRAKYMAV